MRVAWHPQGVEEVVSDRKVHLADRSLMPGDVVRRLLPGRKTQMGYCKDVKVYNSAQIIGTSQVCGVGRFSSVWSENCCR